MASAIPPPYTTQRPAIGASVRHATLRKRAKRLKRLKRLTLLALLALLLPATMLRAENRVGLELLPHATVAANGVRLADVVRIQSGPAHLHQPLQQSMLAPAPRVGQITLLTRAQIEHALRTARLSHGLQLVWHGAQAVQVHLAQQTVAGTRLQRAAQQALEQAIVARGSQARVQLAQPVPEIALPEGELTIRVPPLANEALHASMPVWLELAVNGQFYRRLALHFAIEGDLASAPITGDGVQKGAQVTLLMRQGAVQVQTMAQALQAGGPGQWVRVRPRQATEPVLARVRSGTLVEIE